MGSKVHEALGSVYTKMIAFTVAGMLTLSGMIYTDMKAKVDVLDERVNILFQEKVSRKEFKEEMSILHSRMEGSNRDLMSRQDEMKADILARLDLIIRSSPYTRDK